MLTEEKIRKQMQIVCIDNLVQQDHLLRIIDKAIDGSFIYDLLTYKRPMIKSGFFNKYEYVYDEYNDCYICPNNQGLKYSTTTERVIGNIKAVVTYVRVANIFRSVRLVRTTWRL